MGMEDSGKEEWLTLEQASARIQRSPHTIYNWINRGGGRSKKGVKARKDEGGRRGIWMVEAGSLKGADKSSSRVGQKDVMYDGGGDTLGKVEYDRKRWVEGWVMEGKNLAKILGIFSSYLHEEVEGYYWEAVKGARDEGFE